MAGSRIDALVDGSVVRLQGSVKNEPRREAAHSVPGVRDVAVSELRTGPVSVTTQDASADGDYRLQEDVRDALLQTRGIDASHVNVDVRDGVVYLAGHVHNSSQKAYAHDVAPSIPGVRVERLDVTGSCNMPHRTVFN